MQNSPDPNDSFSGSDLIRVSVGLESIDDIIADFENSLRTSVTVEGLTE